MKVVETEITPFAGSGIYVDVREGPHLSSPFHGHSHYHMHPELQLTLIIEGHGKRIIGSDVTGFRSGDMVFIGSNVPHMWLSDPIYFESDTKLVSKAITVFINPSIFKSLFELTSEMDGIRVLMQQATFGIHVFGKARQIIADKLMKLANQSGFEKVMGLLQILNILSLSTEKQRIIGSCFEEDQSPNTDRLVKVIKYIKDNFQAPISLQEVAEIACMTKPSFCRFFKARTNRKFFQYLEEVRMGNACKSLIETDLPITEVSHLCGYNSNSHFCKVFKDHMGKTPKQFRTDIKNPSRKS